VEQFLSTSTTHLWSHRTIQYHSRKSVFRKLHASIARQVGHDQQFFHKFYQVIRSTWNFSAYTTTLSQLATRSLTEDLLRLPHFWTIPHQKIHKTPSEILETAFPRAVHLPQPLPTAPQLFHIINNDIPTKYHCFPHPFAYSRDAWNHLSSGIQSEINLSHSHNPANRPEINPTTQSQQQHLRTLSTEANTSRTHLIKSIQILLTLKSKVPSENYTTTFPQANAQPHHLPISSRQIIINTIIITNQKGAP